MHLLFSAIDIGIGQWKFYPFSDRLIMVVLYVPILTTLVSLAYKVYSSTSQGLHANNDEDDDEQFEAIHDELNEEEEEDERPISGEEEEELIFLCTTTRGGTK